MTAYVDVVIAVATVATAIAAFLAIGVSARYQRRVAGAQLLASYDQRLYTQLRPIRRKACEEMLVAYQTHGTLPGGSCPTVEDILDFFYMVGFFVFEEHLLSKEGAAYTFGHWVRHYRAAADPIIAPLRAAGDDTWDVVDRLAKDAEERDRRGAPITREDILAFLQEEIDATK